MSGNGALIFIALAAWLGYRQGKRSAPATEPRRRARTNNTRSVHAKRQGRK